MMKQARQMGSKMKDLGDHLRSQTVTGNAGGGMVSVDANGLGEVLRVRIEPSLVERGEREMIEDLLPAALNQALTRAKQLHVDAIQGVTGEMNLPGLREALEKVTGGNFDLDGSDDEE